MGVDMYLKLKPEATAQDVAAIVSAFSGVEVTATHIAIYNAMEQAAPTHEDDHKFWASAPAEASQSDEPGYRYWALLQETPALAVLNHYLPGGLTTDLANLEYGPVLHLGRAHHYIDDVYHNPDGYERDAVKCLNMLHRQFSPEAVFTVSPLIDGMYWG